MLVFGIMTRGDQRRAWAALMAGILGGCSSANRLERAATAGSPGTIAPLGSSAVSASAALPEAAPVGPLASAAPAGSVGTPMTAPRRLSSMSRGDPPAGVPAALYAALFDDKRAWKIEGHTKQSWYEDRPKTSQASFRASCRVAAVSRLAWGVMSEIHCEGLPQVGMHDPLSGFWLATAEGLYHTPERPGPEGFEVTERGLVIAAAPVAAKKEESEREGPDFGRRRTVKRRGQGWCADDLSWGGDEGWVGRCFEAKTGFTSGRWGWAGGGTHEAELQAVAR